MDGNRVDDEMFFFLSLNTPANREKSYEQKKIFHKTTKKKSLKKLKREPRPILVLSAVAAHDFSSQRMKRD